MVVGLRPVLIWLTPSASSASWRFEWRLPSQAGFEADGASDQDGGSAVTKKPKTEKLAEALLAAAYEKLPARMPCPKCKKTRSKSQFGLRVMTRDSRGIPMKTARQSYCVSCRG